MTAGACIRCAYPVRLTAHTADGRRRAAGQVPADPPLVAAGSLLLEFAAQAVLRDRDV